NQPGDPPPARWLDRRHSSEAARANVLAASACQRTCLRLFGSPAQGKLPEKLLDIGTHLCDRLIAQVWISFHRLHKYLVESGAWRYVLSIPGGWLRRLRDHFDHDCLRGGTVKQRSGRQHLKEYDSQRIDIGARVSWAVSQSLGSKELRSANNPACG